MVIFFLLVIQSEGFLNWMISNQDKSLINTRRQIRCMNCQHYGHPAKNCPQPPAAKRCYMCGNEGHLQPRCPNKICYLVCLIFTNGDIVRNLKRFKFCLYSSVVKNHKGSPTDVLNVIVIARESVTNANKRAIVKMFALISGADITQWWVFTRNKKYFIVSIKSIRELSLSLLFSDISG